MTAYEKVMAARDANKLTAVDYIAHMFGDSFIELHGDRRFADDKAIVAGLCMLYDTPLTVIGIEKGRNTKERMEHNFGQAQPEGYRKALRLMKQAEKFHRPVLCLVDTSGAYPGIGAEERGQGQAIAENLMEMMTLKTPILTILIGEGGSGGALALAVSDEVWMMENAVYSVISPEGCASILWKDSTKAPDAAEALKMTAQDLFSLNADRAALCPLPQNRNGAPPLTITSMIYNPAPAHRIGGAPVPAYLSKNACKSGRFVLL